MSQDGSDGPAIRASALHVLDYLMRLKLTEARWERVGGILAIAADAAAAGDLGTLRSVVGELELAGPVRVIRIGGAPVGPPPPKIRERVELVRSLLEKADDAGEPDGEGSSDGR